MSTVKITDLPESKHLSSNTANTVLLGVDIGTDTTYKFTIATLAEGLYHNAILKVGEEPVTFANTIAQFKSSGTPFLQVNLQNIDGSSSSDYVATADIGSNANNFIDMGINGSTFNDPAYSSMKALDGYLYVSGSLNNSTNGNLVIGTASANANVVFAAGGTTSANIVAEMTKYGLVFKNAAILKFNDGSTQSVAAAPANYTQSAFNTANGANGLAAGAYNTANAIIGLQSGINTTQNNTTTAVNQYAASAYNQANVTIGVDATQNTNITLVNQYAGGAFAKANAALANSTGIFGGSLTISNDLTVVGDVYSNDSFLTGVVQFTSANGNITTPSGIANEKDINIKPGNELGVVSHGGDINLTPGTGGVRNGNINLNGNTYAQAVNTANFRVIGTANVSGTLNVVGVISGNAQVVLQNTNFSATESAFTISASPTVATPSNDGYMIHISGKNGVPSRVVTDSYGTGAYVVYAGRAARGTVSSPTALQANDIISRYSGNGYGTTKYQALGTGRIDFVAAENYTDANTGSRIEFWNCPVGSNTLTNIATFNGSSVIFTGTVEPQKGFIYTPRTYPGAQTAITIDFANNSVLRANTSAGLSVSFSNYVAGKVVELWITNTAGGNQTFTHGCAAINSTTNSTTYTIPGTSTILAKYISFDGDLGNTFVSVIHA